MFADTGISDELFEKIVAFIDREAGRDAPLTADDEAMVRNLLLNDADIRQLAEGLRTTNADLDGLLDDVGAVEVPAGLVSLIRGHASNDVLIAGQAVKTTADDEREAAIVDFRQPLATGFGYGGLAAAACLALFASLGALLHVYTTYQDDRLRFETTLAEASKTAETSQRDMADASAELERLTALAEQSIDESDLAKRQLTSNSDVIQRLETEQAALQNRYDQLAGENERLSNLADTRSSELAALDQEHGQVMADLSSIRGTLEAERNEISRVRSLLRTQASDLTDELASKQQRLAELSEDLENTLKRSATNDTVLADMRAEQRILQGRIASLQTDQRSLGAERDEAMQRAVAAEQQMNTLQANLAVAENLGQASLRAIASLETDLAASKNWLGQISQYHRVYASTARRHLVEVGADEQEHIEQWLGKMLKRPVPVPDLSAYGVTFQGARLLGINERPVAQLVYLDADNQPLALCIIPNTKDVKDPTLSADQDLNLVDWRDGQHGYAVVGWSDPELLNTLTQAIRPIYDL